MLISRGVRPYALADSRLGGEARLTCAAVPGRLFADAGRRTSAVLIALVALVAALAAGAPPGATAAAESPPPVVPPLAFSKW